MAMTGFIRKTVDLDRGVRQTPLGQLFATSDHNAQTLELTLHASGRGVDADGATVIGYFMRSDEQTVVVAGRAAGNVVTLPLPESCYAVAGHFSLIVKVALGDERKAVFWGDGDVTLSSTDVIVDPGDVVPSLEELLARIGEMERATQRALSAAENADASASGADEAAGRADDATQAAKDATQDARELTDRWDDVDVKYEALPPSENPWAAVDQTAHSTTFRFGLPRSNLAYSTFEVNDGMELVMTSPDGFSDIGFELTQDGNLEVVVN